MMASHDSADELYAAVRFSDGHSYHWRLPASQTADEALEELRQVIVNGQWFRIPGSTKAYSPHSIVTVDIGPSEPADSDASIARRLGEAVGEVMNPDD